MSDRLPVPFCSCSDTACPNHPSNHDEGCTRCIRKCLTLGEIPSCFFYAVEPGVHQKNWFYADFADAVNRHRTEGEHE